MESLPSDIVLDIVSRVPAESVLDCKLVCKKWETLFRGSNFAKMHLSRQLNHLHGGDDGNHILAAKVELCLFFACRIDDPDVIRTLLFHGGQPSDVISIDEKYIYTQNLKRIYHPPMHNNRTRKHLVGSCNGLVCTFQQHSKILDPIFICNPLTREYVYLPELVVKKKDDKYDQIACGFGYVRSTNEYKVVRIHYPNGGVEGNVEVYTLGSGYGWRAIGGVSYRLSTWGAGTYANDAIYWITGKEVVAFDLADEKFRLLSVPPCVQNRQCGDRCDLVALGGNLCIYVDKLRMEIWSLMKSSDSKEAWCMGFNIDFEAVVGSGEYDFQPILLTNNGEIILLCGESVLYCYDTKTTYLKMISDEASIYYFDSVEAIAHVNSLASLKAMGENSKTYTARRTPLEDVIDELNRVTLGDEVDTMRFGLKSSAP